MNGNDFEEYKVTVNITFSDGSVLDVTDYVREIQIMYSLNLAVPEVAIIFQQPITKLEQNIETVDLKVETYKHAGNIVHTDRYKLVPTQTQHTIDTPLQKAEETFNQVGFNTSERVVLFFYIKSVYDTVNHTVGPLLKFNVTLQDILNEILPDNCELQIQSQLELDKILPQVFIKRQPFLSALNYLKYWFGLSKGPVCTVVVPKLDDTEDVDKTVLLLDDINVSLTQSELYRLELVVRASTDSLRQDLAQEYEGTKFVIDHPVHFSSNVISPVEYTFVIKPYKKLYQKLTLDETKIINQYGAANKGYYPDVENLFGYQLRERRIVNNHTGFDESFSPLTSMYAYEYMFNARGLIRLESIPTFRFLWPSDHIKLTIENPDFSIHSGLYITESALYRLTREESREWQLGVELSVVRSNTYYQQTPYTEGVSEQPTPTPSPPNLSVASDEVSQLEQQTQTTDNLVQQASSHLREFENQLNTYNSSLTSLQNHIESISNSIASIQSDLDQIMRLTNLDECTTYLDNVLGNVNNVLDTIDQSLSQVTSVVDSMSQAIQTFHHMTNTITNLVDQVRNIRLPTLEQITQQLEQYAVEYAKECVDSYVNFVTSSVVSTLNDVKNIADSLEFMAEDYVRTLQSTVDGVISSIQQNYNYLQNQLNYVVNQVNEWKALIENSLINLDELKQRLEQMMNQLELELDFDISSCFECGNILGEIQAQYNASLDSIKTNSQNLRQNLTVKVKALCEL